MNRYVRYILDGTGLFLASVVASCILIAAILIMLPPTFFLDSHCRDLWRDKHPAIRIPGHIAKNVVGIVLIGLGVFLSVPGVPGQGLLTILVGLILIDMPGKRQWERRLLSYPHVESLVNRLRIRFGKQPFKLIESRADEERRD